MFRHFILLLAVAGSLATSALAQDRPALYRLWSGAATNHFYTTHCAELTPIPAGYVLEGIEGYLSAKQGADEVALHRYWHGQAQDHFYTTNQKEAAASPGYVYEGIVGYIGTKPGEGRKPLYRYWQGQVSDHFYTTNAAEIGTTKPGGIGNQGYAFEGIVGYVWTKGQACAKVAGRR